MVKCAGVLFCLWASVCGAGELRTVGVSAGRQTGGGVVLLVVTGEPWVGRQTGQTVAVRHGFLPGQVSVTETPTPTPPLSPTSTETLTAVFTFTPSATLVPSDTATSLRTSTPANPPPNTNTPTPRVSADINRDGQVDQADLFLMVQSWQTGGVGDLDHNGVTNTLDLLLFMGGWYGRY